MKVSLPVDIGLCMMMTQHTVSGDVYWISKNLHSGLPYPKQQKRIFQSINNAIPLTITRHFS